MIMKHALNTLDSEASPFIEQKDVILCRSGIQLYSYNEVKACLGEPPVKKAFYREYRPVNVVVKAQEACKSLPVTKEHPFTWVTPDNWKELAGGTLDKEVSVVALEGESEGEIGIKSNITFYTRELYDYYLENKEVSLGYTCSKHFVDNPEEAGYDIILDEITEVNHLAITRSGRGGSSVAVIDSLLGGIKPMRTGLFAWLASKKQKDSVTSSFGQIVFETLKNSKSNTEEELAVEMKAVLDSCAILKDGEAKSNLINEVRDCFDHKERALGEEEELVKHFDSAFAEISAESIKGFTAKDSEDAEEEPKAEDSEDACGEEPKAEDSEEPKEDEPKAEDSEEPKEDEPKAEDSEDACGEEPKEDSCNKDSVPLDREAVAKMITDSINLDALKPVIMEAVKECLGIKEGAKPEITGGVIDSVSKKEPVVTRDYSAFLE